MLEVKSFIPCHILLENGKIRRTLAHIDPHLIKMVEEHPELKNHSILTLDIKELGSKDFLRVITETKHLKKVGINLIGEFD